MNKDIEIKRDGNRVDIKMIVPICIATPEEYELLYGHKISEDFFRQPVIKPISIGWDDIH